MTTLTAPEPIYRPVMPLTYVVRNRASTAYNGTNVPYNEYNLPVAKMYQWTASVERQLGTNMEAEIAYVASHGASLAFPSDINQIPRLAAQAIANRSIPLTLHIRNSERFRETSAPLFPTTIPCNCRLIADLSGGLTFNANYVWSHFLDDQDSAGWGSRGGTQIYQNAYNYLANYGNSNFDVRNALKGSVVYQLPVGKGKRFLNSNPFLDAISGRVANLGNYGGT